MSAVRLEDEMGRTLDQARDIDSGMSVSDYRLKYGVFRAFESEAAMLTLLAHPHQSMVSFIDDLADQPYDLLDVYARNGAFPNEAYYPVLARLEGPSLARPAVIAARERLTRDEDLQRANKAPQSPFEVWGEALVPFFPKFSEYAAELSKRKRRRLEDLWA